MSIKLLPSRDDLKQRGKWLLRGLVAILILVVLVCLVILNFSLLTWVTDEAVRQIVNDSQRVNRGYSYKAKKEIMRPLIPHSQYLMTLTEKTDSVDISDDDLENLIGMTNAIDAFTVYFDQDSTYNASGSINGDFLLDFLRLRGQGGKRIRTIDTGSLPWTAKFDLIISDSAKYLIVFRYFRHYPPMCAEGVVGIILTAEPFYQSISSRLDSIFKTELPLLLYNGVELKEDNTSDIFRCAMGVIYNNTDTLWWKGNKDIEIKNYDHNYKQVESIGLIEGIEGLRLRIYTKVSQPIWYRRMVWAVKIVKTSALLIEVGALAIIAVLVFIVRQAKISGRRNRIALAHIAHSVKTPVARLRLGADLLTEEQVASPDEERRLVKSISDECDRLERSVHNAALSLDKGKLTLNPERCDLTQLVKDVAEAWKPAFEQSKVSLTVECDEKPLMGSFDREMVTVMLDNLVDNALRHAYLNLVNVPEGEACVKLRLSRTPDKAQIIIEDSGPGISKPDRKLIFKRFRRSKSDALTGVSGLGLGLALVKEIAEAHGGSVRVEDSDLGGARFLVELSLG